MIQEMLLYRTKLGTVDPGSPVTKMHKENQAGILLKVVKTNTAFVISSHDLFIY